MSADSSAKQPGRLIVFEGMDGTGKTTLSKTMVERYSPSRKPPVLMVYPSHDGEVGKLIRRVFSGEARLGNGAHPDQDRVLGYLMVADGLDREHLVRDHLATDTTVICDRHPTVSGWIYQRECWTIDRILAVQQRDQFVQPTVTFIVDVPPDVAMERMRQRGGSRNPIYEKDGFGYVSRLRSRYLAFAAMHDNVLVLDGTKPIDELVDLVHSHLKQIGVSR